MRQQRLIIAALFVLGPLSAFADPIIEDFETAPPLIFNGDVLSGIIFNTGGSVLSVVVDVSGNNALNVLGDPAPGGGALRLDFIGGWVASISADVTDSTFPVVIDAYDFLGNLLGSSNSGGQLDIPDYETLSFSWASPDIAYVLIHDSGNDWFVDNITYSYEVTSVPEPGTLALLGIGLMGIGLSRRRKKI